MITLYGKEGCGLCKAAGEKLDALGLQWQKRDLFAGDWRADERGWTQAMAAHAQTGALPIIDVGGLCMTYPQAMKALKRAQKGGVDGAPAGV